MEEVLFASNSLAFKATLAKKSDFEKGVLEGYTLILSKEEEQPKKIQKQIGEKTLDMFKVMIPLTKSQYDDVKEFFKDIDEDGE